jgi:predicted anti-sigma-YlaC factor YlaD
MNNHLNEMQLFALLDANDSTHSHLQSCDACRDEFNQLRASLTNFRLTADTYAESYAPSRLLRFDKQSRTRLFTMPRAAWATGLVAAMALCTATVTLHKPAAHPVAVENAPAAAQTPAPTDDALLQDIDADLSTSVPPSLAPLETTNSAGEKTTTSN